MSPWSRKKRQRRSRKEAIDLDEWFGARPIDERYIRKILRGALDVMIFPKRKRVTVLYRGQRKDKPLTSLGTEQVLRAFEEKGYGYITSLLPKTGKRRKARLRVIGR